MAKHLLPLWRRRVPRRVLALCAAATTAVPLWAMPADAGGKTAPAGPGFAVNDVEVQEASSGSTTATITVSLSEAPKKAVTVQYVTADGTATGGTDYTSVSGTLTFGAKETAKTLAIPITGDRLDEDDETFSLLLSGASGAVINDDRGVVRILDDDPSPSLVVSDAQALEGDSGTSPLRFDVRLSAPSGRPVTVLATTVDGTAHAGDDYTDVSRTLVFAPGDVLQTVVVDALPDDLDEADEMMRLLLQDVTNATIADGSGLGRILDDDGPATPTIEATDPGSPSRSTTPRVRGFSASGSTVRLYAGDCTGTPLTSGAASTFASPGLPVTVPANATTQLRAQTVSATSGRLSTCSTAFPYTVDTQAPAPLSGPALNPVGPSSNPLPLLSGTAEPGSTVTVYAGSCSGTPLVTTEAAQAAAGIGVPVPRNATTALATTVTDAAGNVSPCATGPSYTHDDVRPAAPTNVRTNPASPNEANSVSVLGSSEPGTTVQLFASPDCSGPALGSQPVTFGSFSIGGVMTLEDATTSFSAAATDAAGNRSVCSASYDYVDPAPVAVARPTFQQASPPSPYTLSPGQSTVQVTFQGSTATSSPVDLYADPMCSTLVGPTFVTGTTWQLNRDLMRGTYGFSVGSRSSDGSVLCTALPTYVVQQGTASYPDANEPNDTTPTPVSAPVDVLAAISPPGDVDTYAFTVTQQSTVQLDATEANPGDCTALAIDPTVVLVDSTGNAFAENDDIDPMGNYCSRLTVDLAPGDYVARVTASSFSPDAVFPYRFQLQSTPAAPPGDGNDDPSTAPVTGPSSVQTGTVSATDTDWYRVTLPQLSDVHLWATAPGGGCTQGLRDGAVAITSLSAPVLVQDSGSAADGCPSLDPNTDPRPRSLPAGPYAVGVAGGSATPYELHLQLGPPTPVPSEFEPNDNPGQAQPLRSRDAVTGNLFAGDQDWFRVDLPQEQLMDVETAFTSGCSNPHVRVEVRGQSGGPVIAPVTDFMPPGCSSGRYDLPPGVYLLRVFSDDASPGGYRLHLTPFV